MKKKIVATFVSFIMVICLSGVAFADYTLNVKHSEVGSPSYSVLSGESASFTATVEVPLNSSDTMFRFLLMGTSNNSIWKWSSVNGVQGVAVSIVSCVGSNGFDIPYYYSANGYFVITIPSDEIHAISITVEVTNTSDYDGPVVCNPSVSATYIGVSSDMTLQDYLDAIQEDVNNLDAISYYLEMLKVNSDVSNSNLQYIISQLEWIVAEMEGNVVSNLLGEYAGYNYSQLFVEMINAIKNISIGDITGNITVQTDLSQVISNLVTVANAYNNINQFDYTGKMYFRPVNIISRYGPNQGVSTSAYNPSIEYLTLGGQPSFRIVPQESRVYKVDLLNMKLGVGANNTLLPLMPGNYRISFRVLTRSVSSTLSDFDGSTLYLYNTDVGFIPLEWSAVEDSYSSGYFVYSCSVDVYIPTGLNSGSVQLYFPNGSGIWSNNSVWTIEFQQLDLTSVEINDHLEQIAYLIEQTNNLLAQINENIDNSNLGSSLDSYDQIEGTAQNNFEADYSIVTGAIDGVLGVVGSSGLTNVVAFINGNFTKIWNAMGIFKTLIVTSLLFGLALVFVGRSGKVK